MYKIKGNYLLLNKIKVSDSLLDYESQYAERNGSGTIVAIGEKVIDSDYYLGAIVYFPAFNAQEIEVFPDKVFVSADDVMALEEMEITKQAEV